ncbi:MAG: hypothetical protein H7Z75_09185 [Ferruginibacter sp.]|nr:hypothetical protein [Cytophagales bacterium]
MPAAAQESPTDTKEWQKSIPAQVFLNYFFAMGYHLQWSEGSYAMQNLTHFLNHNPSLSEADTAQIRKQLHNCWSTEYALRSTAELGDEHYLRNALHWTFPQAYYSIFAGLRAFLYTHGVRSNNSELVRREVGRLVVKGFYPTAIGFYAAGHYNDFRVHRLPLSAYKPSLNLAGKELEAQSQIGQFLRTTRKIRAKAVRQRIQDDPNTALRSVRTGEILQKFDTSHWQQLTWRFGYTTFFDLLGRLKISANHREIERFVEADINFKLFHESLLHIVSYLNFVHECFVAKAVGLEVYQQWVEELPVHLRNGFVKERLTERIEPVLNAINPPVINLPQLGMSA